MPTTFTLNPRIRNLEESDFRVPPVNQRLPNGPPGLPGAPPVTNQGVSVQSRMGVMPNPTIFQGNTPPPTVGQQIGFAQPPIGAIPNPNLPEHLRGPFTGPPGTVQTTPAVGANGLSGPIPTLQQVLQQQQQGLIPPPNINGPGGLIGPAPGGQITIGGRGIGAAPTTGPVGTLPPLAPRPELFQVPGAAIPRGPAPLQQIGRTQGAQPQVAAQQFASNPSLPGTTQIDRIASGGPLAQTPGAPISEANLRNALFNREQGLRSQLDPFRQAGNDPTLGFFAQGGPVNPNSFTADALQRAQQFQAGGNLAAPTQGDLFQGTDTGTLGQAGDIFRGIATGDFTNNEAFRQAVVDPVLSELALAGLANSGAVGPAIAQAVIPFALQGAQGLQGIAGQEFGQGLQERQQRQAELEAAQRFGLSQQGQELSEFQAFANAGLGARGLAGQEQQAALAAEAARRGLSIEDLANERAFFGQQRGQNLQELLGTTQAGLENRRLLEQGLISRAEFDQRERESLRGVAGAQAALTEQGLLARGQLGQQELENLRATALGQEQLREQGLLARAGFNQAESEALRQDILARGQFGEQAALNRAQLDAQQRDAIRANILGQGQLAATNRGLESQFALGARGQDIAQQSQNLQNDIQRGELEIQQSAQRLNEFVSQAQVGIEQFRADLDAQVQTGQLDNQTRDQLLREAVTQFESEMGRAAFFHQQDLDRINAQQAARGLDLQQLQAENQFALGQGQLGLGQGQLDIAAAELGLSADDRRLAAQAQQNQQANQLFQLLLAAAGQERLGLEAPINQLTQLAERLITGPFGQLAPGTIGQSTTRPSGGGVNLGGLFGFEF